jgi:rhamnogalacturonyl hydrolase YesR
MTDFISKLPVSTVTNPVLHWLFKHEWQDPGWAHRPVNQIALGLVLNDLSNKLADRALQEQAQALAQKVIAENVRSVTK